MGLNIFALVTEWAPAVTACRAAGGLDFYWNANVARNERFARGDHGDRLPELPYLTEIDLPGTRRTFLYPGEYYDFLRPHLPSSLRAAADPVCGLLPNYGSDWVPDAPDDLAEDAATDRDGEVLYALRPASVRDLLAREPRWADVFAVAEEHPVAPDADPHDEVYAGYANNSMFEMHVEAHLTVLRGAAAGGRGVVVIASH